jgi:hypothetical protein
MTLEERFWSKVKIGRPDDCWEWQASRTKKGYGSFGITSRKVVGAHRIAWELTNGSIPEGLEVLHSCDNPPCCNPAHLFLGTKKDNRIDCVNKNRQAVGERQGNSKLTASQVIEIRQLHADGQYNHHQLAGMYNTTAPNICWIVNRKRWTHI